MTNMLGVAVSYDGLRKLIASRRKELGLSQLAVDDIAGLQGGYTGKLECGDRCFGDMSLSSVLGALGLQIAVVVAAGNYANSCEIAAASIAKREIHRKKMSAMGGRACAAKISTEKRRAIGRAGANKRWRNWREVQAEKKRKAKRAAKKETS